MMSKININKTGDINALRTARQNDIRQVGKNTVQSADNKAVIGDDKLQLSNRAAEVGKLVDDVKELPDVRQGKVTELRGRIEAGEYNPSSEAIADAILKDESGI